MKIIGKFIVNDKTYIVLKGYGATHVMPESEYKKIWGILHPEHWEKKGVL